jgi:tetratricopeptide (TPR) repeat protein
VHRALVLALSLAFAPPPEAPPEPPLASRGDASEASADALPAADASRPSILLDLALRRHAEAAHAGAEERERSAATPRADARRAEAVRLAEKALEAAADGDGAFARAPEALLVAGLDAARIGRARDALRHLGALVRRHPDDALAPYAWVALGEHHAAEGDLTRARAAFEVASRTGDAAVRGWAAARRAELALAASDGEGAAEALLEGVAAGSERALALLDALATAPAKLAWAPSALARLADAAERSGALAAALAVREALVARVPRGALPEVRAAAGALRAELAPAGAPRRLAAGLALPRVGEAPAAAELAATRARLAAAPGDPAALSALGLSALDRARPGEARVLLERAARASGEGPARAAVEVNLAAALHLLGRADEARGVAAGAAARAPALAAAHEAAGALALAAGDAAGAERFLAAAVALEPARWQARVLRAEALAQAGRAAEALAEASRVLDLERGQANALQLAIGLRDRAAAMASASAER